MSRANKCRKYCSINSTWHNFVNQFGKKRNSHERDKIWSAPQKESHSVKYDTDHNFRHDFQVLLKTSCAPCWGEVHARGGGSDIFHHAFVTFNSANIITCSVEPKNLCFMPTLSSTLSRPPTHSMCFPYA